MPKTEGEFRVNINQQLAGRISQQALQKGIRAATIEAERLVIDDLSKPGKGEVRRDGSRASAPGDPPAADTGRLRQSVSSEVTTTATEVVGKVSANAEYAAHLEIGTESIAPRPFMSRLLTVHLDRVLNAFRFGAKI